MTRQLEIKQPFNLELSLMMGQAFRWRELGDGWFSGVIGENLIHIRQTNDGVEYRVGGADGERAATNVDDDMVRRYFREDDDIAAIYVDICRDPKVATIVAEFPGLRILRQDPWECMVSFICSANNSVEGISKNIETLSEEFGKPITLGDETRLTFPTYDRLADATEEQFRELNLGFKASYVAGAATRVSDTGINLVNLRYLSYDDGKTRLMNYVGIGRKIADCIALFSLDKIEAFPMDRWVWRAVTEAYPEWGFPEKAKPSDKDLREASEQARQVFGKYAGYANQYLFHWRRLYGEEPLPFATRWRGKLRITPPEGRQLDDQYLDDLRYEYLRAKYLSC